MVTTNFPNGITSYGVPVVGPGGALPVANTNYWFVNSVTGSNGNAGTADAPFATLAYACSATSNLSLAAGDVIIVQEGHAESVTAAAGIALATAGVQVVGTGTGTKAPTITFTTATTATIRITGAGCVLQGLRFVNGIASLATMLDIRALGVSVQNNAFVEGSATTGLTFIDLVGVVANVSDGLKILGNSFFNPTAGNYTAAIKLTTVQDNVEIGGNYIYGTWSLSGIHNITGKVMTNLNVHDNYVKNLTAAVPALNFISTCTGVAYRNVLEGGDATVPSAKFGTGVDASGGNIVINGRLDAGSEFWLVKKGVVSSTILQTGVDLTVVSIGGELAIEDVIVKTDGTGLAAATNFQITSNNANGLLIFFSTAVSGLGANKTINMSNASVTANGRTVLELGKKLILSCTAADCTGAGTIDVYVKCRRITAGANVSTV